MPARKTTLKLIAAALVAGALLIGILSAGAADLPAWTIVIWVAAGFLFLWLAVWWLGDAVSDDPPLDE